MKVLIINAGSSSLKFQLYAMETEEVLAKGLLERIKTPSARLKFSNNRNQKVEKDIRANSYEAAISQACLTLMDKETGVIDNLSEIKAIGHRVVHGGAEMSGAAQITDKVKQIIIDCYPLAPIHNPPNYEGIEACEQLFPNVPMVAVFDTAFHQSMPASSFVYAIPGELAKKYKIRRYGFHGTSHKYVAYRAAEHLGQSFETLKLITAHLGNGCSITAIDKGQVIDTSMGLTPLEGLVMGTRCGDIDPAVVFFLNRRGYSIDEIDKMLNKSSGLAGISQTGKSDMRDMLEAAEGGHKKSKLALDVFIHRIVKYVGAYAAVLNGFDALVFTAGIGENVAALRHQVCEKLGYLGVQIDRAKNKNNDIFLTDESARPAVMVVPTNEELMIARQTVEVLHLK